MVKLQVARITTAILVEYIKILAAEYLDECKNIEDLEFFMDYQYDDRDNFYRCIFRFINDRYRDNINYAELEDEEELNKRVIKCDLILLEDYEDDKIAIDDLSDEEKALEQAFEEIKEW